MEITIEDVKGYLATNKAEEVVGNPRACSSCLAANTIWWKYREVFAVVVDSSNKYATVRTADGVFDIPLSSEVEAVADRFDEIAGGPFKEVTRQEISVLIPELFK